MKSKQYCWLGQAVTHRASGEWGKPNWQLTVAQYSWTVSWAGSAPQACWAWGNKANSNNIFLSFLGRGNVLLCWSLPQSAHIGKQSVSILDVWTQKALSAASCFWYVQAAHRDQSTIIALPNTTYLWVPEPPRWLQVALCSQQICVICESHWEEWQKHSQWPWRGPT